MKGLMDFLQSASNTVAGNIAGPVDLLSAGLNKVGVPVGNRPVGGTEWMRQMGLWRDVEQSPASVAGETFGLLGPMLGVAKAPQIAKGLLQMGDNLAAPTTLNPQAGAIVWHGSPHKFSKFDSSKIGTGEGAQAYGHGLYLAESPDVARSYQASVSNSSNANFVHKGKPIPPDNELRRSAAFHLMANKGDKQAIYSQWKPSYWETKNGRQFKREIERLDFDKLKPAGALYKVDLPDEHIAKMLDWDKPFSEMTPQAQSLVQKLGFGRSSTTKGKDIYGRVSDDAAQAAQMLREAGIPGIRYLDGGSRSGGAGTSNFVVFPGNEDLLKILEVNGKGLLNP